MSKTILQVPLSIDLKKSAEKQALAQGFSSLQEAVRVFLNKFASATIHISFKEDNEVKLSKKNEIRYLKMIEDMRKGKNSYKAKSVEDFFKQLDEYGNKI